MITCIRVYISHTQVTSPIVGPDFLFDFKWQHFRCLVCVNIYAYICLYLSIFLCDHVVSSMMWKCQANKVMRKTDDKITTINKCERTSPVPTIPHASTRADINFIMAFSERSYTSTRNPGHRRKFHCREYWYLCCVCYIESPETLSKTCVYYVCIRG